MKRWLVDLVQLASTISTKDFKYYLRIVDHFLDLVGEMND